MKNLRRGFASLIGACLAAVFLMALPVASAQAATVTYFNGTTVQNQVKVSPTTHMTSGTVYFTDGGSYPNIRLTVSGYGSSEGAGSATITGFSATTYQYCQWRWGFTVPGSIGLTCKYTN